MRIIEHVKVVYACQDVPRSTLLVVQKERTSCPEGILSDIKSCLSWVYETLLTYSLQSISLLARAPLLPLLLLAWSSASLPSRPHPLHHPPRSGESCSTTSTATARVRLPHLLQSRDQEPARPFTLPSPQTTRTILPTNRTLHHSLPTPSMSRLSPRQSAHRGFGDSPPPVQTTR